MCRIVFIGAERVGLMTLLRLVALRRDNIVTVFTADESLRSKIADYITFDPYFQTLPNMKGIPLCTINDSQSPEFIQQVRELQPDLIFVISWSQIIPKEILEIPKYGCVGLHYSLLPYRRGGAPLNWAIMDGEVQSGVTLFYLDEGIDTGDVIDQVVFSIGEADTPRDLLDKIVLLAPDLIEKHIDGLETGGAPRKPQLVKIPPYPCRKPEDGLIDIQMSMGEFYNFIRALAPPYPGAFIKIGVKKLTFTKARFDSGKIFVEGVIEE